MISQPELDAIALYSRALRTGELATARFLSPYLDENVTVHYRGKVAQGREAALDHLAGVQSHQPAYSRSVWTTPRSTPEGIVVDVSFPSLGAAPDAAHLTFKFTSEGLVESVTEESIARPPQYFESIPDAVRARIDAAEVSGLPLTVAYVDLDGIPRATLRGSTQVYGPRQISIWLRSSTAGLSRALPKNPHIALLYRDNPARVTMTFNGRGHIESDEAVRRRVYETSPDLENRHDDSVTGSALIIDIDEMWARLPQGDFHLTEQKHSR